METTRILALSPPGSMERVLNDLRQTMYGMWGAVSALALPPIIPVCPWILECSRPEASGLLSRAACAQSVCLSHYERVAGHLFLSVRGANLDELWRRLRESLGHEKSTAVDGPPEPFPFHRGFLLAGPDLQTPLDEVAVSVPVPEERRFGSYGLSVLRMCVHAPRERWWDVVSWEEEVYVPVKRSGRAAAGSGAR